MKKILALFSVLGCFAQPVLAAEINTLGLLAQPEFRSFSEDLGAALSYKSITPPEPLGLTGFDLGIEVTSTKLQSSALWSKATNGGKALETIYVPKLHVFKGLPLGIDIGAFMSAIPTTNIKLTGFELRYAILEGGVAMPAVGIRGSMTKLSGVNQLAFSTKALDVSVSKGFLMFTPYVGVGSVWTDSNPNVSGLLAQETFRQNKAFAGANLNMGLMNLALEYDKTGSSKSYGLKLGFRF